MKQNRREIVLALSGFLGFAATLPSTALAAMNKAQKMMITTLPVTPWLELKKSTPREVRAKLQEIVSSLNGASFDADVSSVTNGESLTINRPVGSLLQEEKDLQIISLHFDPHGKLELAMFVFNKGWEEKNIVHIRERLDAKYTQYERGRWVKDTESDNLDRYYIFDIGRFVVELSVPQGGSFLTVNFTTKEIHKKMRSADGTYEIFQPLLDDDKSN